MMTHTILATGIVSVLFFWIARQLQWWTGRIFKKIENRQEQILFFFFFLKRPDQMSRHILSLSSAPASSQRSEALNSICSDFQPNQKSSQVQSGQKGKKVPKLSGPAICPLLDIMGNWNAVVDLWVVRTSVGFEMECHVFVGRPCCRRALCVLCPRSEIVKNYALCRTLACCSGLSSRWLNGIERYDEFVCLLPRSAGLTPLGETAVMAVKECEK